MFSPGKPSWRGCFCKRLPEDAVKKDGASKAWGAFQSRGPKGSKALEQSIMNTTGLLNEGMRNNNHTSLYITVDRPFHGASNKRVESNPSYLILGYLILSYTASPRFTTGPM